VIQKNPYFKHSKISPAKTRQILRYFAMDLTATDCAELSGISVRSINTIYLRVRRRLAEHCETISPLGGELEPMSPTSARAGCVACAGAALEARL
jgi:transposase